MESIKFTKYQFETLMKLVYMGEWLVNAHRTSFENTQKFCDLEEYILSHANKFGFEEFVITDEGETHPSAKLESDPEVAACIEEFTNETFWDELCDRLSERDAFKIHGEEKLRAMSGIDRVMALENLNAKYFEIFSKEGLDNIYPI